jgi:endonuclease/exonuclease/phosphatase family metal-dependent hydrolase
MRRFFVFLPFLLLSLLLKAQETITVMQYNLLEYGNYQSGWASCDETTNNTQDKDEAIRVVLDYVKPDILTVNEFGATQAIQNNFISHNLNIDGVNYWKSDNIVNYANSNIINHIFYNSDKMVLKKHAVIRTSLRDIDAYELYFKTQSLAAHDTVKLVCMVAHLKAGDSNDDVERRKAMLQNAMYYVDEHYANENVLIMGDFNMYSATESGYRLLTATYENPEARFVDPLSLVGGVGTWDNNRQYAPFHTQSTKSWVDYPDCPSGGGLDSRFDIMMMSDEVYMGFRSLKYLSGSFHAVGNDGNHFNMSINQGVNNDVPTQVANALFTVSDHLPVVMKLNLFGQWGVDDVGTCVFKVYPNPTSGMLRVDVQEPAPYQITNVLGQHMMSGQVADEIDVSELPEGIYFIRVNGLVSKFVKTSQH